MKLIIAILLLAFISVSCNSDKTAPLVSFSEDTFCTTPGGAIEVTIEVVEENILDEIRMTASDLDFNQIIEGSVIEDNGGMLTIGFNIDPDTPDGTYDLNIQAEDDSNNISLSTVTIKVQS